MSYQVTAVAASDDYVFVIFHLDYEREGRKLDADVCSVCRMREGRIIEFRDLYFDQVAADAFWS